MGKSRTRRGAHHRGGVVAPRGARAALRAHGLSGPAIEALLSEGPRIARDTRRHPQRERAWLVDNETGERIGEIAVGTRQAVRIGPLLRALGRRSGAVVFAHTHPDDVPFSDADAAVLLCRDVLALVLVTAKSWYLLSPQPASERPSVDMLAQEYERAYSEIEPAMRRDRARVGRPGAQHRHGHALWTALARTLRLRYDRVGEEPPDEEPP